MRVGTVQAQTACSTAQLTAGPNAYPDFFEKKRGCVPIYVEIGAGEEIRTLDPNLGKVVLYP